MRQLCELVPPIAILQSQDAYKCKKLVDMFQMLTFFLTLQQHYCILFGSHFG